MSDNKLECWGPNSDRSPYNSILAPSTYAKKVSIGSNAVCSIDMSDNLNCTGDGETDVGMGGSNPNPNFQAKEVTVDTDFACAIKMDNTIECWYGPVSWQSNASWVTGNTPSNVAAKSLISSGGFACAVRMDDTLQCWQSRNYEPTSNPVINPQAIAQNMCAMSISNNILSCHVAGGPTVAIKKYDLGAGNSDGCVINTDDTITCWGDGTGDGGVNNRPSGLKAYEVEDNWYSGCAIVKP